MLWDIDGTLIRCSKVPRNAIMRAMNEVYGTAGDVHNYPFSGRTDPQIVFDLIKATGAEDKDVLEKLPAVLEKYVAYLDETLTEDDVVVLPGVKALLRELDNHDDVLLGLLTGNLEKGAQIKLARAGLDVYFFRNGIN